MRGRKPLPSNVVKLRGDPGKRRLNDAEPRPAGAVPSCPSYLGEVARKEWKRLAKELADLGLLTRRRSAATALWSSRGDYHGRSMIWLGQWWS